MYGFSSFYWNVSELAEADRRAVEALNTASQSRPSAGYATHDLAGLLAAYRTLLDSADVRARGVALDQYAYAEAQGRWGADNPMTRFAGEVRAQARAMLATTPEPGVPLAEQPRVIAGWNSALGVLKHLADGDTSDIPRIVEVLSAMFLDNLLDVDAFMALEVRLVDADAPTCARVGAWLAATMGDERLPHEVRISAVKAFDDDRYSARLGPRDALAGLLDNSEIRLSVIAANTLLHIDESYEPEIRRAVAGWPDDASYPANEVREILADADELARARASLAAVAGRATSGGAQPTDAAIVVAVLKILAGRGGPTDVSSVLAILDDDDLARAVAEYPVDEDTDIEDTVAFGTALNRCLGTADEPTTHQANTRLAAVFTDAQVPVAVRVLAVRPFWSDAEPGPQEDALTGLLAHDDLRLSTAAAFAVVDHAGSEPLVRQAVTRWPDDAPYPASKVRRILADLDALAEARTIVAAATDPGHHPPTDVVSLLNAVHTMLYDGDDTDGPRLLALLDSASITAVFDGGDRTRANELSRQLHRGLHWRLADGADDPRYAAAIERLADLRRDQP